MLILSWVTHLEELIFLLETFCFIVLAKNLFFTQLKNLSSFTIRFAESLVNSTQQIC